MCQPAFAAIDIGSNTFRMMIAEHAPSHHPTPWKIVAYTHRIIRLGEGLHQSGELGEAAMQRALQAFREFSELLQQHHISPQQLHAVATAAMREARNGLAFCQRVAQETGIHIQVIQGEVEANLSLAGSCAVLPSPLHNDFLLFDIGGGSTEFVRAKHSKAYDAISCKLGVVRLVEAHLRSDPPSHHDYEAMKQTCQTHLAAVEAHWLQQHGDSAPPQAMVGTAGTVTTLAAVDLNMGSDQYDANIINNHCITLARFTQLKNRLLNMTLEERQAIPAIEKGRADLMIAGLAIIESIFERWHYSTLHVVDAGLLEGAWLKVASQK